METEGPPRLCFSLAGVAATVATQGTDALLMLWHLLLLIRLPPQQLLLLMPFRHMSLSDIFLTTDDVRRVQWIHHAALEKEELAEASTSSFWKKELTIVQALQATFRTNTHTHTHRTLQRHYKDTTKTAQQKYIQNSP